VRYEFTGSTALELIIESDRRVLSRQRTGNRGWGPLEPIPVPNNDRCVPVEIQIWDAELPEPVAGTVPPVVVKPRKHSPQTGTSKVKPKDQ
jgi:hypothetical protein